MKNIISSASTSGSTLRTAGALALVGLSLAVVGVPTRALAACGDGALDGADVCDDANTQDGDGCSATCTVEAGFACTTQRVITLANGSFDVDPTSAGGGWTLLSGSIDWVDGTSFGACWPSGDGTRHVDMNGSTRGQLFQDIATVPGDRVVVTFLGNANCILGGGETCSDRCTKRLTVSVSDTADATATAFATSVYDLQGQPRVVPWSVRRFEFVARSTMTRLAFTGSDPSPAGPFLDRIRIAASVCEPMTCGDGTLGAGEACDDGNDVAGDGCGNDCRTEIGWMCPTPGMACRSTCGDAIVVSNEECDDGDAMGGDGCSATCTVEPGFACALDPFTNTSVCVMSCGNGTLQAGEACDDGNMIETDACSRTCLRGPGETCAADLQCNLGSCAMGTCAGCYDTSPPGGRDFGCGMASPACDTSGALPRCVQCIAEADCTAAQMCTPARMCAPRVVATCGDGTLAAPETCDDGNVVSGDGCSATCSMEMGFTCPTQRPIDITNGSFELEPLANGWSLDTGSIDWVDGTAFMGCLPAGDGIFAIDTNGATRGRLFQDITTTPGQRVVVSFLGNANCVEAVGDSCDLACNKILTVSVSDPADTSGAPFASNSYDLAGGRVAPWRLVRFEFTARTASTRLTFTGSDPSFAGPMVDRISVSESVCTSSRCGDGTIAAGERCDDGNNRTGDGCGTDCLPERGWTCGMVGRPCTSTCGDGLVVASEECDDGGTAPLDGCSATCTLEGGFACVTDTFTNRSTCRMTCGDGARDGGEECDDGNTVDSDACSNTCRRGPLEPCVVDPQCQLGLCQTGRCAGCYDTAGPGAMDFGCLAAQPICDTSARGPLCVECLTAADCTMGEVCVADVCAPPGTDAGPPPDAAVMRDAATSSDAATTADAGTTTPIDAGPRVGGASGGACVCGVTRAPARGGWLVAIGALATLALRRGRRRARQTR